MILQDEYAVPPVDPEEVVVHATTTVRRPRSPWEGLLAWLYGGQEAELIDVWEVLCLTDY